MAPGLPGKRLLEAQTDLAVGIEHGPIDGHRGLNAVIHILVIAFAKIESKAVVEQLVGQAQAKREPAEDLFRVGNRHDCHPLWKPLGSFWAW